MISVINSELEIQNSYSSSAKKWI